MKFKNRPVRYTSIALLSCALQANAQQIKSQVSAEYIAEFKVDCGVSYVKNENYGHANISPNGFRVDAQGVLHLAYQDYTELKYARINSTGDILEDSLVGNAQKKCGRPTLAQNSQGIYYLQNSNDKTAIYSWYNDAALYFLGNTTNEWELLHTLYTDAPSESQASWMVNGIQPDPYDNIHIFYSYVGWFHYGNKARDRIVSHEDHTLGGWNDIATRSASGPDTSRNSRFSGTYYLGDDGSLIYPAFDHVDANWSAANNQIWLSKTESTNYESWQQGENVLHIGDQTSRGFFQDKTGDVHAVFGSSSRASYSLNWGELETIPTINMPFHLSQDCITVKDGKIFILFHDREPGSTGNLHLIWKQKGTDTWSEPIQLTNESVGYQNRYIETAGFARPFTYRTEPDELYVTYSAMDGVPVGNDFIGYHIRVLRVDVDGEEQTPEETTLAMLEVPTENIYPGDEFTVPVILSTENAYGIDLYLGNQDLAVAEINDGFFGPFFGADRFEIAPTVDASSWRGALSLQRPARPFSGTEEFAEVDFTATAPGVVSLSTEMEVSDINGHLLAITNARAEIIVFPYGEIFGEALCQGRTDHSTITVDLVGLENTAAAPDGSFSLRTRQGVYSLVADAPKYLPAEKLVEFVDESQINAGSTTLRGGDCNDDNEINIGDFTLLGGLFRSADASADINNDGRVNIQDLAILGGNFGLSGAQAWDAEPID